MILPLEIRLASDGTFARGDGVAGLVDAEVSYERATGLPYVRARVFRGLLVEACAEVLFQEQQIGPNGLPAWIAAAGFLFGQEGSKADAAGHLRPEPLRLPASLRRAVWEAVETHRIKKEEVLASLTTIRRQTAIDPQRDAARRGMLRSSRLVVRETMFETRLVFEEDPAEAMRERVLALTVASVYHVQRGGWRRNRGRGRLCSRFIEGGTTQQDVAEALAAFRKHFPPPEEGAV